MAFASCAAKGDEMKLEYRKLDDKEIAVALAELPDWALEAGELARTFSFGSYAAGVMFAAAVGQVADAMDHHPDLTIGYQKLRVSVHTHSVGGLSPYDFELAKRINRLVR